MLVRRVRDACAAPDLQCVGTSATMATGGTAPISRPAVAEVATRLFGAEVTPERVIGETLVRATAAGRRPGRPSSPPRTAARRRRRQLRGAARPTRWPAGSRPRSGWTTRTAPGGWSAARPTTVPRGGGRARRADRRRTAARAPGGAAAAPCWPARRPRTRTPAGRCSRSGCTSSSPRATRCTSSWRPRTAGTSPAPTSQRSRRSARRPCCRWRFCRECGQEYLVVADHRRRRGQRSCPARTPTPPAATRSTGYLYVSHRPALARRPARRRRGCPDSWLDRSTTDGSRPSSRARRKYLPEPVWVGADGTLDRPPARGSRLVRPDAVRVLPALRGLLRAGPRQRLRQAGHPRPGGPVVGGHAVVGASIVRSPAGCPGRTTRRARRASC